MRSNLQQPHAPPSAPAWTLESQYKLMNNEVSNYIPAFHQDFLYLIWCYGQVPEEQKISQYSIKDKAWKVLITTVSGKNNKNALYFPKVATARVLIGAHLYCFGGIDGKGIMDNRISCLNLTKRIWRCDLDLNNTTNSNGIYPQARSNAGLGTFKQRFLILWGGQFLTTDPQNFNNLWVFDLEKCNWHKVANLSIPYLSTSTFCTSDEKCYIFGHHKGMQSGQMFEIKMQAIEDDQRFALTFQKGDAYAFNPQKDQTPELGIGYRIFSTKNRMLVLFVTSKTKNQSTRMWVFDRYVRRWLTTEKEIRNQIKEIVEGEQNNFYFIEKAQSENNIIKFTVNLNQIKRMAQQHRFRDWSSCQICYEAHINQNTLMQPAFKISKQLLETMTQKIDFPLGCFGIFAENAFNHSASYVNFHYTYASTNVNGNIGMKQQEKGGVPMLKVEDDGRLNYMNEEFEEMVVNFSAETNYSFQSVERRVRTMLQKDFLKKQFGTNLKIASLRLGSQMLYISAAPNFQARVAYFTLENQQYVCYYYAFDEKSDKTVDDYSHETKLYVQSKYRDLITSALHENASTQKSAQYKNTLYILNLRTIPSLTSSKPLPQLQPSPQYSDILYTSPNSMVYHRYLEYGCKINEAIDVSLVAYLSHLFIKNDHMRMSVQIGAGDRKYVRKEENLDGADKNAMIKLITAIDSSLKNYDLKSVDLMFNCRLNKRLGIFHNGVLLYHRNRLIKRFGVEFGDLLNELEFSERVSYGYFNVFGRIEVPDALEVNQQKTDFLNKFMMEKLYSRLSAIHLQLKPSIDDRPDDQKHPIHNNPNNRQKPKLRSKYQEELESRQQPVKKVKKTPEDESYHGIL